ncbi:MAG: flippase-like domain-containing protein [Solirubrobacterales bacterium]|nr:flippase-like domain-containing protein [Solirubrobacterales bacterium]
MSATPETPSLAAAGARIVDRVRRPAQRLAGGWRGRSAIDRRGVSRRLLTILVLGACVITALLAVPDLRPVAGEIADMNPALVAAALGLELASCLSFVVIFRLFFRPVPKPLARNMAWSQLGSGALLPGGGLGSLAVGGWLLHLVGMSAQQIVRRSSGLFFLTSAINVFTLAAAGLLLLFRITDGPHDMLRAGLPVIAALAAIILVVGLPNLTRRVSSKHPKAAWLEDIGIGIPAARQALTRPSWRLLGALGYLLFDIAVLWMTFAAVGPLPPLAPLIVAYLAGYLANAIPIPGGIGVLDSGLVGALTLYGLPVTHAAAAVLVYHAIAFWIPTLGGTLAYARLRPRLVVDERQLAPPRRSESSRVSHDVSLPIWR